MKEQTDPEKTEPTQENILEELKWLAEKYDFTHIVVYARRIDGQEYLGTQGVTDQTNEEAAQIGNALKGALGWDKSTHRMPVRSAKSNRLIN